MLGGITSRMSFWSAQNSMSMKSMNGSIGCGLSPLVLLVLDLPLHPRMFLFSMSLCRNQLVVFHPGNGSINISPLRIPNPLMSPLQQEVLS